ncbi:hypothetical protein CVAR292_00728 [Corynebacterium variabile]|uniref:Uncharacterized protein n=1 Tax=Corynebacterium variabile TaxID=1727 RepID=A0A0X2NKV7_9CORY|nr:hypothetical protein CVAR292_00728 [Corynebacterium variabile]
MSSERVAVRPAKRGRACRMPRAREDAVGVASETGVVGCSGEDVGSAPAGEVVDPGEVPVVA